MEWITRHVIIIIFAYVMIGQSVTCIEMIKKDPGDNMTVTWSIEPLGAREFNIICEHHIYITTRSIFGCYEIIDCIDKYADEHIRLATDPPFNYSDPRGENLKRLGIFITKVNRTDAGLYRFKSTYPLWWEQHVLLYVYQEPSKPVITSIMKVNEVILTCRSTIQSLPKEYRNTSLLEYTWNVNNLMDNYDIDNDKIRIISPRKANYGGLFSCKAREVNSKLTSQVSHIFFFKPQYLENIQVDVYNMPDDTLFLSCAADCNPECNYTWLKMEGDFIADVANTRLESYNESDVVTCHATNLLGTLSQKIELNFTRGADNEQQTGYQQSVVISLVVLLVLAAGVTIVIGVLFLVYRRRHGQTSQRDAKNNTKSSDATGEKNDPIYVNQVVVGESSNTAESTYDQLDE